MNIVFEGEERLKSLEPDNGSCPFGPEYQKYWDRRYDLFKRFNDGIKIDCEGLFSTKPEDSAAAIAVRLIGDNVLDAFSGVGGSAIAFARQGKNVISVDICEDRLYYAKHNAKIYCQQNNITFKCMDAIEALETLSYDSVYLDPPWGGPDYYKKKRFTFKDFFPNGTLLILKALDKTPNIAITVPVNFDINEMKNLKKEFLVLPSFLRSSCIFYTIFLNPMT